MAIKKKRRKTRVTKKDLERAREERKVSSYQRKKKIIPGPWTNLNTDLQVSAKIRNNKLGIMAEILGPSLGSYTKEKLFGEKGWYPIVFNIESDDMQNTISKCGMDQFLAAVEKSLNKQTDSNGKPKYGTVVIMRMSVDNSQRDDKSMRFISCRGKTNKKNIPGFRARRKGGLITIGV